MFLRNSFFFMAGIGFLALAKAKNLLKGYSTPKPYAISETARCVDYDIKVVDDWLAHLKRYSPGCTLAGKNVLELGPGSDLGIGIYLLSKDCARYNACDVNDIVKSTPAAFYDAFLERLAKMNAKADIDAIRDELEKTLAGRPSRLNYVVRDDFDIVSAFGKSTIDLVFSQAAFEHFDDVPATISTLGAVCRPGALLTILVDLKTHSRWIRDKDPNNIYRYPAWLYDAFRFRGIPNRVRPYQYVDALESSGWKDVAVTPLTILDDRGKSRSGMDKAFSGDKNQMECLSVIIQARRP